MFFVERRRRPDIPLLAIGQWTGMWPRSLKPQNSCTPSKPSISTVDLGSRWQQVIDNSNRRVRIQSDNMEQVRRDTIHEWSGGALTIDPIPRNLNKLVPVVHSSRQPKWEFKSQHSLSAGLFELIEADGEFSDSPSLSRLCSLVAELMHRW